MTEINRSQYDNSSSSWDEMDPVFEEILIRSLSGWYGQAETTNAIPITVYETDTAWILYADLPGLKADDMRVQVDGCYLKIQGQFQPEREQTQQAALVQERSSGRFYRAVVIPVSVDADKMEVVYQDGVLKVQVPRCHED